MTNQLSFSNLEPDFMSFTSLPTVSQITLANFSPKLAVIARTYPLSRSEVGYSRPLLRPASDYQRHCRHDSLRLDTVSQVTLADFSPSNKHNDKAALGARAAFSFLRRFRS